MKKLGKLSLNEMQGYATINPEEQMAIKGGVMTPYHWAYIIYTAWKISKDVMDMVNASGSSSTPSGSNIIRMYGPDSVVVTSDGTKVYYPDSVYVGSGN
jgi:hypothetical protein